MCDHIWIPYILRPNYPLWPKGVHSQTITNDIPKEWKVVKVKCLLCGSELDLFSPRKPVKDANAR